MNHFSAFYTRSPEFLDSITSKWNLPAPIISELHKYYLLHWSGEYFQSLYYTRGALITHQGHKYGLIWLKGHTEAEILSASRVAISFRKHLQDDPIGFAIVRPLNVEISSPKFPSP